MECPSCQARLPEGGRFCDECGAPVPIVCQSCGAPNRQGAKFCAKCGSELAAGTDGLLTASASSADRRQLTILFCDLVGSTALAARMDPEDLREVIGTYQKCVAEIVGRFDGFVARYMGDGVLAYFGYPQSHEDDAERAMKAGLALVEAVGRLELSERLQTRIGIATGLVVVGDLVGCGEAQERGVVGETPNVAVRLQALAAPDSVVIAASTHRLGGGLFEYEDLGALEVKGFSKPLRAWRVLRETAVESRFEALHPSALTPIIGRNEEIELLLRRWQRAKTGEGQVVSISGEPGIGKSRLTVALQQMIQAEPHTRLRHFCSPHHQNSALFPFITQLQRAGGFTHADTPRVKLDKLAALLAPTLTPEEDVALLAELLSIPTASRYPALSLTPQRQKDKTFAALLRQVEALAHEKPLLMIFEDAHWSDPTSRDLLHLTVEQVQHLPVLLLVTSRPDLQLPWIGQAHVMVMMLSRLNQRNGSALVRRISGDKALPGEVIDEIVGRGDGVPLFVEELTKALLEGVGAGGATAESAVDAAARRTLGVPTTLHGSLMARLDRLGPAPKEVAQVGSVIGREFTYELLAAIGPLADQEKLRDALQRLTAAGLIVQRDRPPFASYGFKHVLLQDAAYASLLRGKRQQIHAAVKGALEDGFPEVVEAQPELLAFHCMEAGLVREAIDYWERAGRQAAQRYATREAAVHFRRALELLKRIPESAERDRTELNLLIATGAVMIATVVSIDPEVVSTYARAGELAHKTGRSAELFPALWGAHLVAIVGGDFRTAANLVDQLFDVARSLDDTDFLLQAHHAAYSGSKAAGELMAAQRHAEAVLALYQPERHSSQALSYGAHDPGSCAQMGAALMLLLRGFPDQAACQVEQALALARRLRHPPSLAHALRLAGELHNLRREPVAIVDIAENLLPLTVQHGSTVGTAIATMLRGWARVMGGSPAEGLEDVREGLRLWRQTGSRLYIPYRLGVVADALAVAGQQSEALQLLEEAIQATEQIEDRWFEAELHRLKGVLLAGGSSESRKDVEFCLQHALTVARSQDARLLELRAATSLARFWRDQDRCDQACALLSPIYGWFTEGFNTPDLRDAKALLDELN
jgi:class 3 adenylate cyclase/predicted ATPase